MEFSETFGKRIQTEFKGSVEEKLDAGHRLVTGRKATPQRMAALVKLMEQMSSSEDSTESNTTKWTVIAQVLLNLDETLTW